jgi:hypothetical protein
VRPAAVHCVADCIVWRVIPESTEWQHIGSQIDAAFEQYRVGAGLKAMCG